MARRPRHDGSDADDLTPEPSCAHDARQARLPDGGVRVSYHLRRTRPRLEPGRAAAPRAWPQTAGPYRSARRKIVALLPDLLGRPTLRALLHGDQHTPLTGRGRRSARALGEPVKARRPGH